MPSWWADRLKEKVDQIILKDESKGRVWEDFVQGPVIGKGTRDQTLFSIGCSMRARGADYKDILVTLERVNQERCVPMMKTREVIQKAEQASKYTPGCSGLLNPLPTDAGNAERLAFRHGSEIRYADNLGGWLIWDGIRWIRDETREVYRRALETVRAYQAEAKERLEKQEVGTEKEKEARKIYRFAIQSEFKSRLEAMVDLAKCQIGIPIGAHDTDKHPYLINFRNGTYDLRKKSYTRIVKKTLLQN